MKLSTLKEAIQAMYENEFITDARGRDWRFDENYGPQRRSVHNDSVWYNTALSILALPVTIKEEPEYLYEWVGFTYSLQEKAWVEQKRLCKSRPNLICARKTGRKFQLIDDLPVEVKE